MKYKEIVNFIDVFRKKPSFKRELTLAIETQVARESSDIYEKLLLYAPELNEKSKKYIKKCIELNEEIFEQNQKTLTERLNICINFEEEPEEIDEGRSYYGTISPTSVPPIQARTGYVVYDEAARPTIANNLVESNTFATTSSAYYNNAASQDSIPDRNTPQFGLTDRQWRDHLTYEETTIALQYREWGMNLPNSNIYILVNTNYNIYFSLKVRSGNVVSRTLNSRTIWYE